MLVRKVVGDGDLLEWKSKSSVKGRLRARNVSTKRDDTTCSRDLCWPSYDARGGPAVVWLSTLPPLPNDALACELDRARLLEGAGGGRLLLDDALLADRLFDISRERDVESSLCSRASERKLRMVPIEVVDIRRDLRRASAISTSSVR